MKLDTSRDFVSSALRTIQHEQAAIGSLASQIDERFNQACATLLQCRGRIIVTGMGKSGHIGHKIAATLASTGSPAFFVHPGEASHGDLGMITRDDAVIAISNSGNSNEILTLLPILKRWNIPLIAMTGNPKSTLAQAADVILNVGVASEACPLDLAPTSSTTVTLVMGDAIAVALLEARGFTAEQFALSHPGGSLGRRLLLRVSDLMHSGDQIPAVTDDTPLSDTLTEISQKGFGITTVTDKNQQLVGVFTDGDLRRVLDRGINIGEITVADVMSRTPATIVPDMLAAEALSIIERNKITALIVANNDKHVCGILHMHDLLRAGIA